MIEAITTSGTGHRFAIVDRGDEIDFESLSADDEILIQTANSSYKLTVIEPAQHRCALSGGSLGDNPYEVIFIGALDEGHDFDESCSLKTGARALFYIESPRGLKRMITSKIANLSLLKSRCH